MRVIGIDPGKAGAVASIWAAGGACVDDLPVISDRALEWIDGGALQTILLGNGLNVDTTVVVERVSAMPKQGVASCFKFGMGFGSILSVVQAIGYRIEFVTPTVWKRDLGLGSDKKAALHKARLLFPSCDLRLAKHDGRAEALLIAHWFHVKQLGRAAA